MLSPTSSRKCGTRIKGGFLRYFTFANTSDVTTNAILLYAFVLRLKANGANTDGEDYEDYAREHGACRWARLRVVRLLLNIMGEWEAPAILTQIIKNSSPMISQTSSSSSPARWSRPSRRARSTRTSITTRCYLKQEFQEEWTRSSMHYVAAQFIWPVVGVARTRWAEAADGQEARAERHDAYLRNARAAHMLNLLIA